eukprot:CAMPEP_0195048220 /NCGR_PEP_ID=MMETSP0347-20130606/44360_1 /TAXON_ID=2932 /ORGANISM="Alexandrium fundyense, Strain CCMP1719" /LENGTH=41 /DNA_ID= /DNA_START= /DNA_END= /DNA_ORIENTATION=
MCNQAYVEGYSPAAADQAAQPSAKALQTRRTIDYTCHHEGT